MYLRSVAIAEGEASDKQQRKEATAIALRLKAPSEIDLEEYYPAFLDMVKNVLDGQFTFSFLGLLECSPLSFSSSPSLSTTFFLPAFLRSSLQHGFPLPFTPSFLLSFSPPSLPSVHLTPVTSFSFSFPNLSSSYWTFIPIFAFLFIHSSFYFFLLVTNFLINYITYNR